MSEKIDLVDPALWSTPILGSNDRQMLDPVDGRPFESDVVPTCIREDALLWGGVEFLRGGVGKIRMGTFYARHVSSEDLDLSDRRSGWFEQQVMRADYFDFEGFGCTVEGVEYYRRVTEVQRQSDAAIKRRVVVHGIDYTGFLDRRARAIAQSGSPTKCFPMDVAGVNNSPLDRGLIDAQKELFRDGVCFEEYVALCDINNVREWVMIARLGLALQERDEGQRLRRLHIFSVFGRLHQDVTRKARAAAGIRGTSHIKNRDDDLRQDVLHMETGVVSYDYYHRLSRPG